MAASKHIRARFKSHLHETASDKNTAFCSIDTICSFSRLITIGRLYLHGKNLFDTINKHTEINAQKKYMAIHSHKEN